MVTEAIDGASATRCFLGEGWRDLHSRADRELSWLPVSLRLKMFKDS